MRAIAPQPQPLLEDIAMAVPFPLAHSVVKWGQPVDAAPRSTQRRLDRVRHVVRDLSCLVNLPTGNYTAVVHSLHLALGSVVNFVVIVKSEA